MVLRGRSLPVYTDPAAPGRLSIELQNEPREVRFQKWYDQMATFETPHKQLSDRGNGLMAFGAGTLLAFVILELYHRLKHHRVLFFFAAWCGLWAIRIPFTFRYYSLRQMRFDYPSWGDSIAIPIFSEIFASVIGCVVLGGILIFLMRRHLLPDRLRFHKPAGARSWARQLFLIICLLLFLESITSGTADGDEGTVISGLGIIPLLFAVAWAKPQTPETDEKSSGIPEIFTEAKA